MLGKRPKMVPFIRQDGQKRHSARFTKSASHSVSSLRKKRPFFCSDEKPYPIAAGFSVLCKQKNLAGARLARFLMKKQVVRTRLAVAGTAGAALGFFQHFIAENQEY